MSCVLETVGFRSSMFAEPALNCVKGRLNEAAIGARFEPE
jgi:hypothetical protein